MKIYIIQIRVDMGIWDNVFVTSSKKLANFFVDKTSSMENYKIEEHDLIGISIMDDS